MAGKCSYTEANTMPWEALCELHEALDYESDYNHLATEKQRAK